MARVLIIGDTHCPAMHPRYIPFLKRTYEKYDCNRVVHIGDAVDLHSVSYHETDPSLPSPEEEYKLAYNQVQKLYAAFPKLDYIMGNHSSLPQRKAKTIGLPESFLRSFNDLWGVPNWRVHPRYSKIHIQGVQYRHGDSGKAGQQAALKQAQAEFCSVVQGHHHSQAGVWWMANESALVFGLAVGCGVVPSHPAMNYGRVYSNRPILGCGVVINGRYPIFEPMSL